MKLVFVNRYYAPDHSATSQMLTDLAVALARDGADVHVVASRQRYDDPRAVLPAEERLDGVTVHRVPAPRFGRGNLVGRTFDYLGFHLAASLRLWRLVRRDDVVVAKTDPPLISVPAGWVARRRGAHCVNWLQDLFPEAAAALGIGLAGGIAGRLMRSLRDRSLRHAAANVVPGRAMQQRVAARGVEARRIAVIPNWADGAALRPVAPEANPLRQEWGLGRRFVVGYSGNMGRAHEFGTMLAAAVALKDERDVVFLFVGGGAQQAAIGRAAAEAALDNVVVLPYQPRERLGQSLGAADVHLVTLRPELEGFVVPSKFYGIAAVGRPTIHVGDPEGEIGTLVREAACGLCVRPGEVAELVAAIRSLRDDQAMRERLGRNARRVFEERYDVAIAVGKWRTLLREAAEGRRT